MTLSRLMYQQRHSRNDLISLHCTKMYSSGILLSMKAQACDRAAGAPAYPGVSARLALKFWRGRSFSGFLRVLYVNYISVCLDVTGSTSQASVYSEGWFRSCHRFKTYPHRFLSATGVALLV